MANEISAQDCLSMMHVYHIHFLPALGPLRVYSLRQLLEPRCVHLDDLHARQELARDQSRYDALLERHRGIVGLRIELYVRVRVRCRADGRLSQAENAVGEVDVPRAMIGEDDRCAAFGDVGP